MKALVFSSIEMLVVKAPLLFVLLYFPLDFAMVNKSYFSESKEATMIFVQDFHSLFKDQNFSLDTNSPPYYNPVSQYCLSFILKVSNYLLGKKAYCFILSYPCLL